ncbi:ABC transporter permease subunit [Solibacillus sp. FSL H8-0523]|uniref:ABC transporter permease n=1 Tax=Solibacillus sp. FSL H8-0523 TaxID=2954511 RepID=UPI00310116BB
MLQKLYNPVLMKELKLRFRFFKSITGMLTYLAALLIFMAGFFLIVTNFNGSGYLRPSESFYMFLMLSIIQMALILFITPGLTAGSISSEREKQTLNMLLMTTQSSWQIVFGKLTSCIAFLGFLLIAGLPIYSVVFLFGGVSPMQLLTIFFFYFVTMITVGSIGIFLSTITKRTITAMITTYGAMVFLAGFTAFFFFVTLIINETTGFLGAGGAASPTSPIAYFWASINPGALVLTTLSSDLSIGLTEMTGIDLPIWIPYLIFYVALTALMLFLSVKKLRVNMKRG